MEVASSPRQPLRGPHKARGKMPHAASLLLGTVWEAKFPLRDKAFQGARIFKRYTDGAT